MEVKSRPGATSSLAMFWTHQSFVPVMPRKSQALRAAGRVPSPSRNTNTSSFPSKGTQGAPNPHPESLAWDKRGAGRSGLEGICLVQCPGQHRGPRGMGIGEVQS